MTQETSNRVPELDGIRGLAILLVMCFHIFPLANTLTTNPFLSLLTRSTSMGWVGVDVFFVLSGFLITAILLNTRDDPDYFKKFYARRILRIFPLYWLVIGGLLLLLPLLSPNIGHREQAAWPYFALYLQNWLAIPSFKLGLLSPYVGPSWSLAIEEQFYLVWPALVLFLSRRRLVLLSAGIVVLSLLARMLLIQFAGDWKPLEQFLYYGSFTRFDGFSVGALIAIAFQSAEWKQRFTRFAWPVLLLSLAGMAAIVLTGSDVSPVEKNDPLNTWGYTLVALISGALVLLVSGEPKGNLLAGFFRNPALVFFGKYSYAMYLLHLPITLIVYGNTEHFRRDSIRAWLLFVGTTFGLTIIGSLLTWNLLEKQMLKLKKYFEYQKTEV